MFQQHTHTPAETTQTHLCVFLCTEQHYTRCITHEYTLAHHDNESQKYDQFLCKITYLLLLPHALLWRPNCDAHTHTHNQACPSITERSCCNFSTAYCEAGQSPFKFSEWGGKNTFCNKKHSHANIKKSKCLIIIDSCIIKMEETSFFVIP